MPALIVSSESTTRAVALRERATIGRGMESDLVVPDPILSRVHAEVQRRTDGYYIVDCGSRNGTFVNESPVVKERRLQDGDVVRAGECRFTFVSALPESAADAYLPPTGSGNTKSALEPTRPGFGFGQADAGLMQLSQAASELSGCASLDEVLTKAAQILANVSGADEAGIALLEGKPSTVTPKASFNRAEAHAPVLPPTELIRQVIASETAKVSRLQESAAGPISSICVPLKHMGSDRTFGFAYATRFVGGRGPLGYAEETLIGVLAHLLTANVEAWRAREVEAANVQARSDLKVAAAVQQQLMPSKAFTSGEYEFAAQCCPSLTVGGDYFDVEGGTRQICMALGDVSGKGAGAAMLMMALRTCVRAHWGKGTLAEAANEMNKELLENLPDDRYATAFLGRLDPASGRLTYVNAGHIPPWILRANGTVERLTSGGTALGLMDNSIFDSSVVRLNPGDTFVACTDGVVEGLQGATLGDDILTSLLQQKATKLSAQKLLHYVLAKSTHASGDGAADDRTVFVFKRAAAKLRP